MYKKAPFEAARRRGEQTVDGEADIKDNGEDRTRNLAAKSQIAGSEVSALDAFHETKRAMSGSATWDGTGLRVVSNGFDSSSRSPLDSVIPLESSCSDDGDRSSEEGTALAARPAYSDIGEALDSGDDLYTDMITPGLHTATAGSMQFSPHPISTIPSSPVPLTLASYLASNLSSPKTRSHSSGSLASFPTDLLSEISRQDSASRAGSPYGVETDEEAGSEFNSDPGESSSSPVRKPRGDADRSALVMPKIVHEVHDSDIESEKAASAARRRSTRSRYTRSAEKLSGPRIMIIGGSDEDQQSLCERLRSKIGRLQDPATPFVPERDTTEDDVIATSSRMCSSSTAVMPNESTRQSRSIRQAPKPEPLLHMESVSDLSTALTKVQSSFEALRSLVISDLPDSQVDVLDVILCTLLNRVKAIDVCLWLLPVASEELRESLTGNGQLLTFLTELVTVIPVISDETTDQDSLLKLLLRHNAKLAGIDDKGHLSSLSETRKIYRTADCDSAGSEMLSLVSTDFRTLVVNAYKRWSSATSSLSNTTLSHRHATQRKGGLSALDGRQSRTSSPLSLSSNAEQLHGKDGRSLTSSMIGSLTIPSTSCDSSGPEHSISPPASRSRRSSPTLHTAGITSAHYPLLDPLHIPSLLRLMGLHFSAGIRSWQDTIFGVFRCRTKDTLPSISPEAESTSEEHSGSLSSASGTPAMTNPKPLIAKRPFFGCCRHRYQSVDASNGNENLTWREGRLVKCQGLIIAGLVLGVAMLFS